MEINDASKGVGRHRPGPGERPKEDLAPTIGMVLYAVLTGLNPAARSSRGGSHRARRGQPRSA